MIELAEAGLRFRCPSALVYHVLLDPVLRSLHRSVTQMCLRAGAQTILDIASATGALCRELHAVGLDATGLDLAEPMIRLARRRGPNQIDYVVGSAFTLPFSDNRFDAAVLVLALHEHAEAQRQVMLAEARRVTRSAGALVIADYAHPPHRRGNLAWQVVRTIEKIAGGAHHAGFVDFMEQGGVTGLLARSGLSGVERRSACGGTVAILRVVPPP